MSVRLLWFTPLLHQQIIDHAGADAPREACGVLIGQVEGGTARVMQTIPVDNIAVNAQAAYRMDDRQLAQIIGGLDRKPMELVGFYHSHPAGDSIPSATDVRFATYSDVPYLIVGLRNQRPLIAAWNIDNGSVERLEIAISDTPPDPPAEISSGAQNWAIITSSIAALIFAIVLALMLLPPAPEIP